MWIYLLSVIIILVLLCKIETPLQYTAKMFCFYFLTCTLATILLPYGLLKPFAPENHKALVFIIPYIIKYLLGIDVEVRNKQYVSSDKPFVLLLNHQSSLDAWVMMHVYPERCVTIMKRELFYLFPFGITAWLFGSIFLNRQNSKSAKDTMSYAGSEMKKRNVKIIMFPEGTRNRDGDVLPFKKGAFNLAVDAQIPIVPAAISSYQAFYSKKDNRFTDGKVIVSVLPPVSTENKAYEDVPALADEIRDQMVKLYESINSELHCKKNN